MEVGSLELSREVEEQGFDVILHKFCSHFAKASSDACKADELRRISAYFDKHPHVSFDPLDAVRDLNDRHVMCRKLDGFEVREGGERVAQPPYAVASTVDDVVRIGQTLPFGFPWVYKPLVADGVPESHDLAMIFSTSGLLEDAKIPFVLQPFVNHNGQILKVYVLGDTILQIRRPSLPNRVPGQGHKGPSFEPFGRISNAGKGKECSVDVSDEALVPEMSGKLLQQVVKELQARLGIQLFGVDFIRDAQTGDYLVIDVNYLPGYYGVANLFEKLLDLMYQRVQQRGKC